MTSLQKLPAKMAVTLISMSYHNSTSKFMDISETQRDIRRVPDYRPGADVC